MSDAFSDIAQDKRISIKMEEINSRERLLLNEGINNKDKIKKIVELYKELNYIKRGYSTSSPTSYCSERIGLYTNYLEGKISEEELKNFIEKENEPKFHIAVGGHEGIMGDTEQIIINALYAKYSKVQHAFKAIITKDGINLEKISCGECPEVRGGCYITDRCNCFNQEEYSKRGELGKKGKKVLDKY